MLESHEYFESSKPAHASHKERVKNKRGKPSLLKYATLAPAAALAAITISCSEGEKKVEDSISPTSSSRHLETATPHLEAPVKIVSAGVNIETSDGVGENISPTGRSLDQDTQAVIEVAQKFPLPDRFTVVLTNDYHDDRAIGPEGKIIIGINRIRIETMQYEVAHELTHLLDPVLNEELMLKYYTPHQITELKKLREEILSDHIWGRDYPEVEKIILGKSGANVIPRSGETPAQIAAGSDIHANGIWIEGYNPFESDLTSSHEVLAQLQNPQKEYQTLEEFADDNKELLDKYFSASPLAGYAREDFYRHLSSGVMTPENTLWTAFTDNGAYLNSRYANGWGQATERVTRMILFEMYETGRLEEFINSQPESKQDFYQIGFEFKKTLADQEKFADIIAASMHTDHRIEYLETIARFNEVNNLLQKEPASGEELRRKEFDRANNLATVD